MAHMDLDWMVRKPPRPGQTASVTPPAVHLHLGNIASSLRHNSIKTKQTLINSPRSAIVMLRNGVTMDDLKKQPSSLDCEVVEKKPFITLEQLSWDQKRYLAIETARLSKLRQVVDEYNVVSQRVSFDSVVAFCNQYRPDRPSSAKLLPFAGCCPDSLRRSAHQQCNDKYAALLAKFQRREEKIDRSGLLHQRQQQREEEVLVEQLLKAEARADGAIHARREHVRNQGIASRGRSELWRAQRNRHDRVETFRHMVGRETLLRRLDEVSCVQRGMESMLRKFKDHVVRHDTKLRVAREMEENKTLRASRSLFLKTQM